MGVVHASRGALEPASEHLPARSRSSGIAEATLSGRTTVDWISLADNYDRIRDHIEHVVPGFVDYNARVRQPGGFYLPNPAREGVFPTPSQPSELHVHRIPQHDLTADRLLLTTHPQPRPVQHHHLRQNTIATAASSAAAASSS